MRKVKVIQMRATILIRSNAKQLTDIPHVFLRTVGTPEEQEPVQMVGHSHSKNSRGARICSKGRAFAQ